MDDAIPIGEGWARHNNELLVHPPSQVYFAQRGDQRGKYLLKTGEGFSVCPAPHVGDLAWSRWQHVFFMGGNHGWNLRPSPNEAHDKSFMIMLIVFRSRGVTIIPLRNTALVLPHTGISEDLGFFMIFMSLCDYDSAVRRGFDEIPDLEQLGSIPTYPTYSNMLCGIWVSQLFTCMVHH